MSVPWKFLYSGGNSESLIVSLLMRNLDRIMELAGTLRGCYAQTPQVDIFGSLLIILRILERLL
jgi:hypothetical protein